MMYIIEKSFTQILNRVNDLQVEVRYENLACSVFKSYSLIQEIARFLMGPMYNLKFPYGPHTREAKFRTYISCRLWITWKSSHRD